MSAGIGEIKLADFSDVVVGKKKKKKKVKALPKKERQHTPLRTLKRGSFWTKLKVRCLVLMRYRTHQTEQSFIDSLDQPS